MRLGQRGESLICKPPLVAAIGRLFDADDLSTAEIAAEVGCSARTVHRILARIGKRRAPTSRFFHGRAA